ncbi:hypothetical protein VPHD239_0099 [Vibrio phage D239]
MLHVSYYSFCLGCVQVTICGCLRVLVIALAYFGERTKEPILNIVERSSYVVVEVGAFVNPQNSCFYP